MDIKFQDRIDDYLLNRMSDADKEAFLQEVEQSKEKKEQLEFTKSVKDSICSREEKLRALAQLQQRYENEREIAALRPTGTECATCCQTVPAAQNKMPVQSKKRIWFWVSGIAAVFIAGFFAIKTMFVEKTLLYDDMPIEKMQIRGGDETFNVPTDSIDNDTIKYNLEKKHDE